MCTVFFVNEHVRQKQVFICGHTKRSLGGTNTKRSWELLFIQYVDWLTCCRFTLEGHFVEFCFVWNHFHWVEVSLHSTHHLGLKIHCTCMSISIYIGSESQDPNEKKIHGYSKGIKWLIGVLYNQSKLRKEDKKVTVVPNSFWQEMIWTLTHLIKHFLRIWHSRGTSFSSQCRYCCRIWTGECSEYTLRVPSPNEHVRQFLKSMSSLKCNWPDSIKFSKLSNSFQLILFRNKCTIFFYKGSLWQNIFLFQYTCRTLFNIS